MSNYAIFQGYLDAARAFEAEAGVSSKGGLGYVEERSKIRDAIQSGQIATTVAMLNDRIPEVQLFPYIVYNKRANNENGLSCPSQLKQFSINSSFTASVLAHDAVIYTAACETGQLTRCSASQSSQALPSAGCEMEREVTDLKLPNLTKQ